MVRDQSLAKEQQHDFTLHFGEIEDHVARHVDARFAIVHSVTNLDSEGNPTDALDTRGNYFWHTDKSYHAVPSLIDDAARGRAAASGRRHAIRQYGARLCRAARDDKTPDRRPARDPQLGSEPSPLRQQAGKRSRESGTAASVAPDRPHAPGNRREALYIGTHAAGGVEGMDEAEGKTLLADLLAHATQPQFVYTHHWRAGDLVIWDNRALLHRALANYEMGKHRRVLHRTVVRGSVPY